MKGIIKILLLIILGNAFFIFPQDYIISLDYKTKKLPFGLEEKIPAPHPLMSLALSGGGARGFAQIGVLKAFEENQINFDLVVGTSMGSIIGGLYSSGYSIKEIDSIVVNTNWNELLTYNRTIDRNELFIDQKVTEDKAILSLRLKGLVPILPNSISSGQKLSNFFNLLILQAPIQAEQSFKDLKNSFYAVTTDLISGGPYVISSGSLSQALRASSSVSFLLPPVSVDSLLLVDGGLVANLPVDITRQLGGEFVVAVNTTGLLHTEEELIYPWNVADQIVSIPMKQLNARQMENADVVISPESNKYSDDFTSPDSMIIAGYNAALPFIDYIKQKEDSLFNFNIGDNGKWFKNILIDHSSNFSSILYKFESRDSVSEKEIKKELYNLYSTGAFDDISIKIYEDTNYTRFRLITSENPFINNIELIGNNILEDSIIYEQMNEVINRPYNSRVLFNRLLKVMQKYRALGYSLAEIKDINFEKISGTLTVILDEGIISEIIIEGNTFSNEDIIRRELPFYEHNYFIYRNIEQGLRNLRSSNLFEDIVLTVKRENENNIIVIKVFEKESSLMRLGFRIDNDNRIIGNLDIRDENVYGSGTELGLNLVLGQRNKTYLLEHKSNRIFNTYLTYKVNVFYSIDDAFYYADEISTKKNRFHRKVEGEYRQLYYGTSISLGSQFKRFGNVIFKGTYQYDVLKKKQGVTPPDYKTKIVSLKISSTVDTQDKYPYPTNGFYFNGAYETAQTILGGDIGYTNVNFDYYSYIKLIKDHTIRPRIMMGFGDKTLPLTQQYALGGQNSFFGMFEEEYRGRQIFLTSLEYRYKFPFKIFFDTYVRLRYDLGSVWDIQDKIRFKDLKHGIGTTISFDTPIGPADFSVGRSFILNKVLSGSPVILGDVNFYFSIGFYY